MEHNARQLADKLNRSLDELDAPITIKERASILSKMLDIPKPQAWGLLEGHAFPDKILLKKITDEFEIRIS